MTPPDTGQPDDAPSEVAPSETLLVTPFGEVELHRHPEWSQRGRRAWDAADELVLLHLAEAALLGPDTAVVVAHGGQGAVAAALVGTAGRVVAVTDSFVDEVATRGNGGDAVVLAGCWPSDDAVAGAELVVVKVPKSRALLDDTLARLVPLLAPGTPVIGAGMTRHVHTSTVESFERHVGPTTTTRARKKARLLLSSVAPDDGSRPAPSWPREVVLDRGRTVGRLVNHAGVFSADRLDRGTELLVDHLPDVAPDAAVVDLGCGNGVVGLTLALQRPDVSVRFVDESRLAVASARATAVAATDEAIVAAAEASGRWRFDVGDGLGLMADGEPVADASLDAVLINPPFHDDHAVGDGVAWQMFTQAHRALRPGGELRVVANRHLGHHVRISRIFGACATVTSDPRYVVLSAVR